VYLLKNGSGEIIYIGKSINLQRRLNGYFRWQEEHDPKLLRIQNETRAFSYVTHGSDLEALLEEARLIGEHTPSINTQLDIHDPPAEKKLEDHLLVLLPHANPDMINLFILHRSGTIFRMALSRAAPDAEWLAGTLPRLMSDSPPPAAHLTTYPQRHAPLALRWLRKNSSRLTFFKYHDYATPLAARDAILDGIKNFDNNEKNIFI
jgi:hypothetical protein